MTVYISPNPGKEQAADTARRAAQLLLMQGAVVLMRDDLKESCYVEGVQYLPLEECLPRTDVILTIGGDGTILHEANFTLQYQKPILGINIGRCGFLATCEVDEMEEKLAALVRGEYLLDSRMLLYVRVLGEDGWEGHALNDVVVTKGRLQQAIDFSIYCDDILVEHYRGERRHRGDPYRLHSLFAGGRRADLGLADQGHRRHSHLSPQSDQPCDGLCSGAQNKHLCGAGHRQRSVPELRRRSGISAQCRLDGGDTPL